MHVALYTMGMDVIPKPHTERHVVIEKSNHNHTRTQRERQREGRGHERGGGGTYVGTDILIGRFSEAGLLELMRFVIFRARSRERPQRTSGLISE